MSGCANLADFLLEHPGAPDDPIVHWIDGSLTLAELRARAAAIADDLRAAGVAPGQQVAHVVVAGPDALAAMFGVWLAGAVYVPVNGRFTDAEIAKLLDATPPAAVVRGSAVEPVDAISSDEVLPAGTALVMRTSGTTGQAKPIILAHDGVAKGIDGSLSALRRPGDDRPKRPPMPNLVPTSLALWAGIWNALFALRAGAPVVLMDRFDTAEFATLVRRHGIRSTVLAPAMMSMLTEDAAVDELAPLTMVRSITAPLTPVQARSFKAKFGVGIMNCYGQTELGGEVVGWSAADLREFGEAKLGAVGRPHKGVEIKIVDGEVWIRSPYLSSDPKIRAQAVDGYLRTGDLGRVDAEGFLWLEGRAGDVINRGGLKVMPQEIEDALRALPAVADAGVAGVPDERLGEVPMAWIRPVAGATVDATSLLTELRGSLAGYKVPVAVEIVDELPRNEIGKLLRRELVERWSAGRREGTS